MARDREAIVSPQRVGSQVRARVAGVLYFASLGFALLDEAVVHGRLLHLVSLVPIACFFVATLLIYGIFKSADREIAWFATVANLVAIVFEAVEVHPAGINAALVFHGTYCLLIGYLTVRSGIMPLTLGALMMLAGAGWLANSTMVIARHLSPYDAGIGFVGESAFMLWLLVAGTKPHPHAIPRKVL